MTSEIKCPVCQNNLHQIDVFMSVCINDKCKLWGTPIPNLVLKSLVQAKQDLEQSEKCCSAWETQALDYKAETIALSGKLEIAKDALKEIRDETGEDRAGFSYVVLATNMKETAEKALEQIEHKE